MKRRIISFLLVMAALMAFLPLFALAETPESNDDSGATIIADTAKPEVEAETEVEPEAEVEAEPEVEPEADTDADNEAEVKEVLEDSSNTEEISPGSLCEPDCTDWGDLIIEPTCLEQGYVMNICNVCGKINEPFRWNFTEPNGHDWEAKVIPPTCVDQGYTVDVCKECNTEDLIHSDIIAALGHSLVPSNRNAGIFQSDSGTMNVEYACSRYDCYDYYIQLVVDSLFAAIAVANSFLDEDFSEFTDESVEIAKKWVLAKLGELNALEYHVIRAYYSDEQLVDILSAVNISANIAFARTLLVSAGIVPPTGGGDTGSGGTGGGGTGVDIAVIEAVAAIEEIAEPVAEAATEVVVVIPTEDETTIIPENQVLSAAEGQASNDGNDNATTSSTVGDDGTDNEIVEIEDADVPLAPGFIDDNQRSLVPMMFTLLGIAIVLPICSVLMIKLIKLEKKVK